MYQNGYSMTIAITIMTAKTGPAVSRRRNRADDRWRPRPAPAGPARPVSPGPTVTMLPALLVRGPDQPELASPTMIMMTNRMIPYRAPVPNWP